MNKIRRVFHPGYYIKEYIEDLQLTQDEFAKRLGITGKQISLLLSEKASITVDIANKLSKLLGTSVELWLNLQNKYDVYVLQIENSEELEKEKRIYKMIDKSFLIDMNIIEEKDSIEICIEKLRKETLVSSLSLHTNDDIYTFYRSSSSKEETLQNVVCRNVWVSLATSLAKKEEVKEFDENKLLDSINILRSMTLEKPEIFYPRMKSILSDCGVAFVILPALKNSKINGVVKWLDNKVIMALNTRGAYNDRFWFSFFHELKHVLQKAKRKMLIAEENSEIVKDILEYEANEFSKETLISSSEFEKLKTYDEISIINFAETIKVHPGIVVGRLQKEGKVSYSKLNYLKEKYLIKID